jgi:hypothetical protein
MLKTSFNLKDRSHLNPSRWIAVVRDNMPDTSRGIRMVEPVAGDQMDMEVKNGLAGRSPDVDPDIEPVRTILFSQNRTAPANQLMNSGKLFRGGLKIICTVPSGNDKDVSFRNRKAVVNRIRISITADHLLLRNAAKRATVLHIMLPPNRLIREDSTCRVKPIGLSAAMAQGTGKDNIGFSRYTACGSCPLFVHITFGIPDEPSK